MLRRALADSHARGKSIRTLVGNIRAGPQRRRAGAPQDAFCGGPGYSWPPPIDQSRETRAGCANRRVRTSRNFSAAGL